VEFMYAFRRAATALDPAAADITEDKRSPFCTREGLIDLARSVGLTAVDLTSIEVATDSWRPFTLGAGPAPGSCPWLLRQPCARSAAALEADLAGRCTAARRWLYSLQSAGIGGPCHKRLKVPFGTGLCRPIAAPRGGEGRRV
jgi:hypothetical protein